MRGVCLVVFSAFGVLFGVSTAKLDAQSPRRRALAFLPRYTRLHERHQRLAATFAGRVLSRLAVLTPVLTMAGSALATAVLYWGGGRWALVAALALPQIPYLWLSCRRATRWYAECARAFRHSGSHGCGV